MQVRILGSSCSWGGCQCIRKTRDRSHPLFCSLIPSRLNEYPMFNLILFAIIHTLPSTQSHIMVPGIMMIWNQERRNAIYVDDKTEVLYLPLHGFYLPRFHRHWRLRFRWKMRYPTMEKCDAAVSGYESDPLGLARMAERTLWLR